MGEKVNTPDTFEFSAYVTRDGKVLFFMSKRYAEEPDKLTYEYLISEHNKPESGAPSIYWMDAGFIDELRSTAIFETENL